MKKKTQLIGILNCTPDSYFVPSRQFEPQAAIEYGLELFEKGADIVDIGGESTRPQAKPVSEEEELKRVIPVIEGMRTYTQKPISIDTFKPNVAEAALQAGATILNDVSGGTHPLMRKLAKESGAPIVIVHRKPEAHYPMGVIQEICAFFETQINRLLNEGVKSSQIILDPGIGAGSFGKLPEHDLKILKNLPAFQTYGYPLLIGLSRKSFLQKILKKEASEVLSTTLALNTMTALEGVEYLRVHDVEEHREILTLLEYMETI